MGDGLGGISLEDRTSIVTAVSYCDEILRVTVRHYTGSVVHGGGQAGPHVARVCRELLDDGGSHATDWPPCFPFLNPNEQLS